MATSIGLFGTTPAEQTKRPNGARTARSRCRRRPALNFLVADDKLLGNDAANDGIDAVKLSTPPILILRRISTTPVCKTKTTPRRRTRFRFQLPPPLCFLLFLLPLLSQTSASDREFLDLYTKTSSAPNSGARSINGVGVGVVDGAAPGRGVVVDDNRCELMTTTKCDKAVGYNLTKLPNVWGHRAKVERDEDVQLFGVLMRSDCSKDIRPFLCATFYPQCDPRDGAGIYPCRELCLRVRQACRPFLRQLAYDWPKALRCNEFAWRQEPPPQQQQQEEEKEDLERADPIDPGMAKDRCIADFPSPNRYPRVPDETEISSFPFSPPREEEDDEDEAGSGEKWRKGRKRKFGKHKPRRSTKRPNTMPTSATTTKNRKKQKQPPIYSPDDIPFVVSGEDNRYYEYRENRKSEIDGNVDDDGIDDDNADDDEDDDRDPASYSQFPFERHVSTYRENAPSANPRANPGDQYATRESARSPYVTRGYKDNENDGRRHPYVTDDRWESKSDGIYLEEDPTPKKEEGDGDPFHALYPSPASSSAASHRSSSSPAGASPPHMTRARGVASGGAGLGGVSFLVFLALVCAGAILLVVALTCIVLYNVDANVQKQMQRKMHRLRSERL